MSGDDGVSKDESAGATPRRWLIWTGGLWIFAVLALLLLLAFLTRVVEISAAVPGVGVRLPWPALLIALLGLLLCLHLFVAFRSNDRLRDPDLGIGVVLIGLDMTAGLFSLLYAGLLVLSLVALFPAAAADSAGRDKSAAAQVTLLAINDVYRIDGVERGQRGGLARVRALRRELEEQYSDLLVLHAGDTIYPSLYSREFDGEQMIDMLNLLDGNGEAFDPRFFAVFGNHEFDKDKLKDVGILSDRVAESQFTWLRSNLAFALDDAGEPWIGGNNLAREALVDANGVKVGLFGLTTDIKRPEYVARFENPEMVARRMTRHLRAAGADVVIALTHLTVEEDRAILEKLGPEGPDLIIGGHEHARQEVSVGGRWVLKADADATSALVVRITVQPEGPLLVVHDFRALAGDSPRPDATVAQKALWWRGQHAARFCGSKPADCLEEEVGRAAVKLIAEEEQIRSCETNFGNWIADRMRAAFSEAQVAVVNAGGLRLNQNLPPGPLLLRDVEELIQFNGPVVVIDIDERIFRQMLQHAVTGWPGNGRWLQVSGVTFRHDRSLPDVPQVRDIALVDENGARRQLQDGDRVKVAVPYFLVDPTQEPRDGYSMLETRQAPGKTNAKTLRGILLAALDATRHSGIAPRREKRIDQSGIKLCEEAAGN